MRCTNATHSNDSELKESLRLTTDAMRAGVDVIVQARLEAKLAGYADILRRVEKPSDLGDGRTKRTTPS